MNLILFPSPAYYAFCLTRCGVVHCLNILGGFFSPYRLGSGLKNKENTQQEWE
jgi:hypothetical protein